MKKLLATTSVVFMLVFSLQAQVTIKPGVGVNFTNVSGGSFDDLKGNPGFQFGGSVAFGEKFYFEPGVFYQTESVEVTSANNPFPVTDGNFKGFRVPVAVGLEVLGDADSFAGLRIFGGASGFFVTSVSNEFLSEDDYASPKWGVFAGAGVDIAIFYVDLSYQWSLTNITTDVADVELGKSNGLFLTAGLRF
ncbi:outer membrane beta-barrel protein [Algoriphagus sp. NF]|uniref:outer membrane beta-barrel protein n=1 Tax=Algoriphagus sp. NF TaxID=2992756 RepID=UPI00237C063F|nr:outer membrane beta-barrel protein [Algoriphagus sp. NF]MCR9083543.1 outer membrane beta-barrel protein [Cyclobacteriaceae bacterium]MDE0561848.1 outer membrane beta-barrel protein [Algoriphagus sp. NF]